MSALRVRTGVMSTIRLLDGSTVTLKADDQYDSRDPLLRQIEQATATKVVDWFVSDDGRNAPQKVRSVEQATAAPGEYR